MKHNISITLILLLIFLGAHLIGLSIVNKYLPKKTDTGEIIQKDLPLNIERPQVEEKTSFISIFIIIIISTLIALLLMRFNAMKLWKLWFFISITLTITIALNAFINEKIALIIAFVVGLIKTLKPNVIINNLAELFIYGGLAAIFIPILNLFSITILLILISIYDFYAVFKSKHMIELAKFQTASKIFAGVNIPYKNTSLKTSIKNPKYTTAILGGGDIGFTLFFSGVVLKQYNFEAAVITSLITTLFLLGLFLYSKKGKFYPAMPILSLGCFVGFFIAKLILF